jgi:hypothetical protein
MGRFRRETVPILPPSPSDQSLQVGPFASALGENPKDPLRVQGLSVVPELARGQAGFPWSGKRRFCPVTVRGPANQSLITEANVYLAASAWDIRCSVISPVLSDWKPHTRQRYSKSSLGRAPTDPDEEGPTIEGVRRIHSK